MKPKTELFLRKLPGRVGFYACCAVGFFVVASFCASVAFDVNFWRAYADMDGVTCVALASTFFFVGVALFFAGVVFDQCLFDGRDRNTERIEELEKELEGDDDETQD